MEYFIAVVNTSFIMEVISYMEALRPKIDLSDFTTMWRIARLHFLRSHLSKKYFITGYFRYLSLFCFLSERHTAYILIVACTLIESHNLLFHRGLIQNLLLKKKIKY